MTKLGDILIKKSVNKALVSKVTGLSQSRLSELCINETAHLRVSELCKIAMAIETSPCDLLKALYSDELLPVPN